MLKSAKSTTEINEGGATTISAVHSDVLLTHILTRLDGQTLASASCASSQIHQLSTQENLWRHICQSTWPSTNNPRMLNLISTFPDGHRSFFADAFPLLDTGVENPPTLNPHPSPSPQALISAVDLYYKNKLIFSKVQDTETISGWFESSPFRIDLLDPKDAVPEPLHRSNDTCRDFYDDLRLSWVLIDPIGRRAANLSSWKPVSVQRHWLSEEIQVKFATVLNGDKGGSTEFVHCGIVVTCGGFEGGDLHVREVFLQVEDMDGLSLNGKESLVILQRGMENGKRRKEKGNENRERYGKYANMKKERKERREKKEERLDMICVVVAVSIFTAFWVFVLSR